MSGRVDGVEQLAATLAAAAPHVADLEQVDAQVGDLVLGVVRPPRVTGALASTVRAEPDSDGVTLAAGSPSVPYAGVIHNGWPGHHIRAQPFISQAIQKATDRIADKYEDHLTEVLSTVRGV